MTEGKSQFRKGERVQTLSRDVVGTVMSTKEDRKGLWYRVRSDSGAKWVIHSNNLIAERKNNRVSN